MPTVNQYRGMLLEEVILHLLRVAGYRSIDSAGYDPTLLDGQSGLEVRGRGTRHQIDAVADYLVQQPFTNPQRLLVEAKYFDSTKRVGLDVVRNSLGALRDIAEYWVPAAANPADTLPPKSRYHYSSAIFSANEFTKPAQDYAFAHDIYLFGLARAGSMDRILAAIQEASTVFVELELRMPLSRVRQAFRGSLRGERIEFDEGLDDFILRFQEIISACNFLSGAFVARFGNRFPVFLIPGPNIDVRELPMGPILVRIRWTENYWSIENERDEELFTFDLPEELFRLYAKEGQLAPGQAIDLKTQAMSDFQAVRFHEGRFQMLQFVLDVDWIEAIQRQLD